MSESGESDSDTDTKVSFTTPASITSASAMSSKQSNSKFFKKCDDSDSESESDDEVVTESKSTSSDLNAINSVSPGLKKFGLYSESDSDSESDSESESKTTSATKGKTGTTEDRTELTKTRKALKTAQKIKEANQKKKGNSDDTLDVTTSFALDSFQNQQSMMSESFFNKIHIRIRARNSRKAITTIEGIEASFFSDKEKVSKLLKALSCGTRATLKKDEEGNNIIETSGKKIELMAKALCEHVGCTNAQIHINGC
jgi:translation initiation factor 1 (eIF-1/SUI1)